MFINILLIVIGVVIFRQGMNTLKKRDQRRAEFAEFEKNPDFPRDLLIAGRKITKRDTCFGWFSTIVGVWNVSLGFYMIFLR